MQNIEILMKELNLGDEVITCTLIKINHICSKRGITPERLTPKHIMISGNGDGNGNN